MKKIYSILIITLAVAVTTVSCSKDALETSPTTAVSGDGLFTNATAAMVPLNGIYRSMYTAGWSTTGNTHQCFGITAYNLMADVMGEDHIMSGRVAAGSGTIARITSNNAIRREHGVPMIYGVHTTNGLPTPTTSLQQRKPWKVCPVT